MHLASESWEALAVAILRGDRSGLETFAKEVGAWLQALARGWIWQPEDAEEFALDVLQEVIASLDRFDPAKATLKTWSRGIAWKMYADFCARNHRTDQKTKHEIRHEATYHTRHRASPDALRVMVEEVAGLAEEDRELLRLFFEDGLSDSMVANALKISSAAARQKKSRLVRRLFVKLKGTQHDE